MPPDHPPRPIPAILAVVLHDGAALLVRRANPPDAGMWGFPGGRIEAEETLSAAALRELHEETGVTAEPLEVLTALDALDRDGDEDGNGTLRHHFVLVAMLCRWTGGTPRAADDALEARWIPLGALDDLPLSRDVARVAHLAQTRMEALS